MKISRGVWFGSKVPHSVLFYAFDRSTGTVVLISQSLACQWTTGILNIPGLELQRFLYKFCWRKYLPWVCNNTLGFWIKISVFTHSVLFFSRVNVKLSFTIPNFFLKWTRERLLPQLVFRVWRFHFVLGSENLIQLICDLTTHYWISLLTICIAVVLQTTGWWRLMMKDEFCILVRSQRVTIWRTWWVFIRLAPPHKSIYSSFSFHVVSQPSKSVSYSVWAILFLRCLSLVTRELIVCSKLIQQFWDCPPKKLWRSPILHLWAYTCSRRTFSWNF